MVEDLDLLAARWALNLARMAAPPTDFSAVGEIDGGLGGELEGGGGGGLGVGSSFALASCGGGGGATWRLAEGGIGDFGNSCMETESVSFDLLEIILHIQ